MQAKKTLVVVFCMHRCGSSFLANLLERLGMSLGPFGRFAPSRWNKYGYFEAVELTALNDQLQGQFFGFTGYRPGTPEVFRRFCRTEGRWPAEPPIPEALLDRGQELIERLTASGPVAGFKDPRTVLTWPFWRQVFARTPELRVVPLLLIRSPHEIAASLFLHGEGETPYRQLLDLVDVHFKRMRAIRAEFGGDVPVVQFDPHTFADEARRAVARCGLHWDDAVFREVYDPACRHHEASVVLHPAQQAFDALRAPGGAAARAVDLEQVLAAAVAREDLLCGRVAALKQELAALRQESCRQAERLWAEIQAAHADLALVKNSRTWRLRGAILPLLKVTDRLPIGKKSH